MQRLQRRYGASRPRFSIPPIGRYLHRNGYSSFALICALLRQSSLGARGHFGSLQSAVGAKFGAPIVIHCSRTLGEAALREDASASLRQANDAAAQRWHVSVMREEQNLRPARKFVQDAECRSHPVNRPQHLRFTTVVRCAAVLPLTGTSANNQP
jgi:hypothetical protein